MSELSRFNSCTSALNSYAQFIFVFPIAGMTDLLNLPSVQ